MLLRPDEVTDVLGVRVAHDGVRIEVRVAEIPIVAAGDTFTLGAEIFTVQGSPRRDALRKLWTADARKTA